MEGILLHRPHLHRHLRQHGRQLPVLLLRVPRRAQGQDCPHIGRLQEVDEVVQQRKERDDRSVELGRSKVKRYPVANLINILRS